MRQPAKLRWHLIKRGPTWYIDVRAKGRPRQKISTGQSTKSAAERFADAWAEQFKASVGDPTHDPENKAASYSVKSAVADFRERGMKGAEGTKQMYRSKSGHWIRLLGDIDAGTIRAVDVDRYIEARRDEGASNHTLSKELTTGRRIFEFAEAERKIGREWRAQFPTDFKPGYDPRDRWLTVEEYEKLVDYLDNPKNQYQKGARERWHADGTRRSLWVTVAVFTGGRLSELQGLEWKDIDWQTHGGFLTLRSAKVRHGNARKPRHIPLAPELREVLKPIKKDVGLVFPNGWANPALMLTRTARYAGIVGPTETLNDNDLRRTFASWMLQRGATVKEVADLLGHGSTAMVEKVYGHLAKQNLIDAVARLPRFKSNGKIARAG